MTSYESFSKLHQGPAPLLLGNVWDVQSAQVFEAAGYAAVGTSSLAVAKAWGYDDGEHIGFDHLLRLAQRLTAVVRIPVTVDIEGGYSRDLKTITTHIQKLHDAGVAGINLEDSVGGKLLPINDFRKLLTAVADYVAQHHIRMFPNIRTDSYLFALPDALDNTSLRIPTYEEAGASGIFVPGITNPEDIRTVTEATPLPVNVMYVPGLPDYATLTDLGVRRISMGPFLFNRVYAEMNTLAKALQQNKNLASVLS